MMSSSRCHHFRKRHTCNELLRISLVLMAQLSSSSGASHGSLDRAAGLRSIPPTAARDVTGTAGPQSEAAASTAAATAATAAPDDFLTFCVDFDELPEELARSRDYRVVAVTGCQCSGKSTLLNAIFGTGFPVLEQGDDAVARRTTIGAWVDLQLCSPPPEKRPKRPKVSDTAAATATVTRTSGKKASRKSNAGAPAASKSVRTEKKRGEVPASEESGSTPASTAATPGGKKRVGKRHPREVAPGNAAATSPRTGAAAQAPFVLVDVEGTQSRERAGADGLEFDSRTTLFAVMAADVIMLNLWAHDVGRADGQAYSVLRSVFEEAVRLYEGQAGGSIGSKDGAGDAGGLGDGEGGGEAATIGGKARFPKVLMLVLRDVEEDGHLEALDRAARANMEALWRDVDKPRSLRDAELSEIFDLRTFGLPHFVYQRRDFVAKAAALRRSFLEPGDKSFLFRKPRQQAVGTAGGGRGNGQRSDTEREPIQKAVVPLSMLRKRLEGIWASARTNDRLAKASAPRRGEQQGAVAVAALAESCLAEVRPMCSGLLKDVEEAAAGAMPLLQFGSDAKGIVDEAVRSFQSRASRSQPPVEASPSVLREKRVWLVAAVARELEPAFRAHAKHLRQHFGEQFEEVFSCVLGGAADFDQSSRRMSKAVRGNFLEATKLAIPDTPGVADVWRLHWEAELIKLNDKMESRVQDRLSEGTWMLPSDPAEQAAATKKKMPWWKGMILRAAAMYFNYLQATQHMRRARKASEIREREVPRLPLF
ncbi:unnamed protein product [Scytosiphon promiscuus]